MTQNSFPVHLTNERFRAITQAANVSGQPNILPLPFEHEPNVSPNQQVEIIVDQRLKYVGHAFHLKRPYSQNINAAQEEADFRRDMKTFGMPDD